MVEQETHKLLVGSSTLPSGTSHPGIACLVVADLSGRVIPEATDAGHRIAPTLFPYGFFQEKLNNDSGA